MATRQHNQQVHCPNCGCMITHETSFGRWIRNNRKLDSGKGYCVIDQDYWIHRFKTYGDRGFQLLMGVEIKTWCSQPSDAQRDTLHMVNQVMRNRRQTPTKDVVFQAGSAPLTARSLMLNADVKIRVFGIHVLRFSGLGPDDSDHIWWDRNESGDWREIDKETLEGILQFDLDPDTLKPLDLRSHHQSHSNKVLTLDFPQETA